MAERFVLTAEMQLRKPANVRGVVKGLEREFNKVNVDFKVNGVRSATNQVQALKKTTDSANDSAQKLAKTFAVSFKRFVSFSVATRAVGALTTGLSGAINEAIEFEREIVKVSQVSGKSIGRLRGLTNEISRLATTLGVSSQSLVGVSRILTQAGFTADETRVALEALAKTELAPTFDDIFKTSEGVVAIFNQFQEGAESLEGQLGSMNAVAGKFAVESGDLISAVRRTGGVFKASGGSFEELLGVFTAIRSTTRESAEAIATGLRTISVRIQRPETIAYLESLDKNISLLDDKGRFVGVFEAFRQLNGAFGSLEDGDTTLTKIGERLAGFRQISRVTPLIKQFGVAQDATRVALEGQDSLAKDSALAQQSLAVRIQKVREEFSLLVREVFQSSVFQSFANSTLFIAEAFLKLGQALKDIIPLLGVFGTIGLSGLAGGVLRNLPRQLSSATGFNSGGVVPGSGNTDTVPAMLTPGEFVLNKRAVQKVGLDRLRQVNSGRGKTSGGVQFFNDGGLVQRAGRALGGALSSGQGVASLALVGTVAAQALTEFAGETTTLGETINSVVRTVATAGATFIIMSQLNKKSIATQEEYNNVVDRISGRVKTLSDTIETSGQKIASLEGSLKTEGDPNKRSEIEGKIEKQRSIIDTSKSRIDKLNNTTAGKVEQARRGVGDSIRRKFTNESDDNFLGAFEKNLEEAQSEFDSTRENKRAISVEIENLGDLIHSRESSAGKNIHSGNQEIADRLGKNQNRQMSIRALETRARRTKDPVEQKVLQSKISSIQKEVSDNNNYIAQIKKERKAEFQAIRNLRKAREEKVHEIKRVASEDVPRTGRNLKDARSLAESARQNRGDVAKSLVGRVRSGFEGFGKTVGGVGNRLKTMGVNAQRVATGLTVATQVIQQAASSYADYLNKKAEKALKAGEFDSFRTNSRNANNISGVGDVAGAAGQGALIGGAIGSAVIPIVGTAVGAAVGGIGGAIVGMFQEAKIDFGALRDIETQIFDESLKRSSNILKEFGDDTEDASKSSARYAEAIAANQKALLNDIDLQIQEAVQRDRGFSDIVRDYSSFLSNLPRQFLNSLVYFSGQFAIDIGKSLFSAGKALGAGAIDLLANAIEGLFFPTPYTGVELIDQERADQLKADEGFRKLSQEQRADNKSRLQSALNEQVGSLNGVENLKVFDTVIGSLNNRLKGLPTPLKEIVQASIIEAKGLRAKITLEKQEIAFLTDRLRLSSLFNVQLMEANTFLARFNGGLSVFDEAQQAIDTSINNVGNSGNANALIQSTTDTLSKLVGPGRENDELKRESSNLQNLLVGLDNLRGGNVQVRGDNQSDIRNNLRTDIVRSFSDPDVGAKVFDVINGKLDAELDETSLQKAVEDAFSQLKPIIEDAARPYQEALKARAAIEKQQVSLTKELNSATKSRIDAEKNAISISQEAAKIREEAGGRSAPDDFAFDLARANVQARGIGERLDKDGNLARSGNFTLKTGSTKELTDTSRKARARFDQIQSELDNIRSRENRPGDNVLITNLNNEAEKIKAFTNILVDSQKAQIDSLIKSREAIDARTKVERDSLQDLLDGDIKSFLKGQAVVGAQSAVASGNDHLIGLFGRSALSGAFKNLKELQSEGVNTAFGQNIGGRGGLLEKTASAGLSAVGLTDVRQARLLSGTDRETETINAKIRASAGGLDNLARDKAAIGQSEFQVNVDKFGEFVKRFGKVIVPSVPQNVLIPQQITTNVPAEEQNPATSRGVGGSSPNAVAAATQSASFFTEKDQQNFNVFSNATEKLSQAVERLSQSEIKVQLAPATVSVNVNTPDLVQAMGPAVEKLVYDNIITKFEQFAGGLSRGKNPEQAVRGLT